MKREVRFLNEMRAESQGDEATLVGYASKFNSQSQDLGGFRETVMPGAFARSIREGADVKFLMNHDPSLVMGRTKSGTLSLEEDATGLKFRVKMPDTQAARDLYTLVKRGDVDQCSFAFTAKDQSWEDVREGADLYASRKLMDVDLIDVSAVTYPAYNSTEVYARMFDAESLAEVRSAVDGLKAKRGSENQPPENGGGDVAVQIQWPLAANIKDDWFKAFEEAYDDLMKKGGRGIAVKEALAFAVDAANKKVQPKTETPDGMKGGKGKDPSEVPHEVVDTYGGRQLVVGELRWPDKSGNDDHGKGSSGSNASKGTMALESGEKRAIGLVVLVEGRKYAKASDVPAYVPSDKKAQFMEVWNSAYDKAKKDGKEDQEAESSAFAQANSVTGSSPKGWTKGKDGSWKKRARADEVSDPDSPDYDPDDEEYDASLDETDGEGRAGEDREGKFKTVGGKKLTAKDFAFVGDPQDPSTWKLPVHDEGHARNALARFNQTKGIPADKKDSVWKKIVAAAKKFGIKVTEEDSLRAAVDHYVTLSVLNEEAEAAATQSIRDRMRMVEIDLA